MFKVQHVASIFVILVSLMAAALAASLETSASQAGNGLVRVKSAYGFDESVSRLKADIEGKGIKVFAVVDQARLGSDAGLKLPPSTLLIFGNPPLGIQFLTSNPESGIDWPVRVLVREDGRGQVWAVYSDFGWIAARYGIANRNAQFKMASEVIQSITSSIRSK